MQSVEVAIRDPIGLHARPAGRFVKRASEFHSTVKVKKAGDTMDFNAKSITAVLRMGAVKDTRIVISAEGDDETEACAALKQLIEDGFGD